MSGWYRMRRGWQSHDFFPPEPFTEREAWEWLIGNAAWKSTTRRGGKGDLIPIDRGQLHVSDRSLAAAWQWDKKHVRRFLDRLFRGEMLDQQKDQSGTVLTVRNYEVYQDTAATAGPSEGPVKGPTRDQRGTTQEERKEKKEEGGPKEAASAGHAFAGKTVRLNAADLELWKQTYHGIPDIRAELAGIDAWFQRQDDATRRAWFHRTPQMLNRKHQEAIAASKPQASVADVDAERRRLMYEAADASLARRLAFEKRQAAEQAAEQGGSLH
jgi:hypothetical protein